MLLGQAWVGPCWDYPSSSPELVEDALENPDQFLSDADRWRQNNCSSDKQASHQTNMLIWFLGPIAALVVLGIFQRRSPGTRSSFDDSHRGEDGDDHGDEDP